MDAQEEATKRDRVTLYLLLAGGAILVIPLLVLLYLRSSGASSADPDAVAHHFAPRENVADRIKAAQTPAPSVLAANTQPGTAGMPMTQTAASASVADSLGFIKGGSDYLPAEKPATSTESIKPEAAPAPAPKAEVAKNDPPPKTKSKVKSGPKPFMQPHLQGTGQIGQVGKIGQMGQVGQVGHVGQGGHAGQTPGGAGMPQMPGGAGVPDMSKMMQGMMPGAAGAGGAGGMPDMSKMMQGMMPGAGAAGAGAVGTATPGAQQVNSPAAGSLPRQ
jgi:hypothetical protein